MTKNGRVEVREYMHTENVYFDEEGNELGSERNYDDTWHATRESREMTDEERAEWIGGD